MAGRYIPHLQPKALILIEFCSDAVKVDEIGFGQNVSADAELGFFFVGLLMSPRGEGNFQPSLVIGSHSGSVRWTLEQSHQSKQKPRLVSGVFDFLDSRKPRGILRN